MTAEQRLLDVEEAAQYLGGISTWTVRGLIQKGHLKPVRLPSVRHKGEDGRRLLFDRRDLDALIDARKAAGAM
jgi:excisionase family DNA binding protein